MWKLVVKARKILSREPWRRPELLANLITYAIRLEPDAGFMYCEAFAIRALDDTPMEERKAPKALKVEPAIVDVEAAQRHQNMIDEFNEHSLFPVDLPTGAQEGSECDNGLGWTPSQVIEDLLSTPDPFEDA